MSNKKIKIIDGEPFVKLLEQKDIVIKINKLAERIDIDYAHSDPPILLIVLNGGIYFGTDLSKKLDRLGLRHQLDFVRLKRYGRDEEGGQVKILSGPGQDLAGKNVIVAEDIVDDGQSMNFLNEHLKQFNPRSVEYCLFCLRKDHGPLSFKIKYLGFPDIGPGWLVGYGMDSNHYHRGLVDVYMKLT